MFLSPFWAINHSLTIVDYLSLIFGTFKTELYKLSTTIELKVRTHNQNMTVAARAITDRKTLGQRS
jgi:hypothetical protein